MSAFPTAAQCALLEDLEDAYGHDRVLQEVLLRQRRPDAMYAGASLHLAEVFDCLTSEEADQVLDYLCARFGHDRYGPDPTDNDRERDERALEQLEVQG